MGSLSNEKKVQAAVAVNQLPARVVVICGSAFSLPLVALFSSVSFHCIELHCALVTAHSPVIGHIGATYAHTHTVSQPAIH